MTILIEIGIHFQCDDKFLTMHDTYLKNGKHEIIQKYRQRLDDCIKKSQDNMRFERVIKHLMWCFQKNNCYPITPIKETMVLFPNTHNFHNYSLKIFIEV